MSVPRTDKTQSSGTDKTSRASQQHFDDLRTSGRSHRPRLNRKEGDLIIGAGGKSAVGTLVERSTRFVLLLHLPDDHGAVAVEAAMKKAIATLPSELVRSITWDQGDGSPRRIHRCNRCAGLFLRSALSVAKREQREHENENTNGLLRQYMPKGTDLSKHSAKDLQEIQRSLNGRHRKTLDYMMPIEKLTELIALST